MEVKKQLTASSYVISGITYKITPFAAMNAVAVMGTLTSLLVPVLQLAVPQIPGRQGVRRFYQGHAHIKTDHHHGKADSARHDLFSAWRNQFHQCGQCFLQKIRHDR